jgi:NAD+ synthase (glutamine-hydrolysing)
MRIAMAQLNPTVGDFDGNLAKLKETLRSVGDARPDLAAFPEMFLTGYPPQDLLEKEWFIDRSERALARVADISREHPATELLVGTVLRRGAVTGKSLWNSALLFRNGEIIAAHHKMLLPTYDVFDEARYFHPSTDVAVVPLGQETLGISICEDAWNDPSLWRTRVYGIDPIEQQAALGASVFVNIAASPFSVGKDAVRYRLFAGHAQRHGAPFVAVNQVGGNDELVFDGRSICVAPGGEILAYLPAFQEAVEVVDLRGGGAKMEFTPDDPAESVYAALVLGTRDYMKKCGFTEAVLGLSGGIDSAVVCAIAADALGPSNVLGVSMPSPYSSAGSIEDSRALATNLGVRLEIVPISEIYTSYLDTLEPYLKGSEVDVTEENVQARIRGNIIMALSNEHGYLPLSTGNKSELAVGYCTLYGDMSGGLAVISDVPKTIVYDLARHINRDGEIIPPATIDKPPSAELKPDQRDQDTLPPYETLDRILALYIDEGLSIDAIVDAGFNKTTVTWVVRAVNGNEYKRQQAAPGLKVTSKAFGMGRRMPIAARYGP